MMRTMLALAMTLLLAAGCDDEESNNGKKDLLVPDLGSDLLSPDLPSDGPVADGQAADSPVPDLPGADLTSKGDLSIISLACQQVIGNCSGSTLWTGYITPFTTTKCLSVVTCVNSYYTGTCATTFGSLLTCLAGVSSSADCDTKCASYWNTLYYSCTCPASCGVPCPT